MEGEIIIPTFEYGAHKFSKILEATPKIIRARRVILNKFHTKE
jgi:hypothetical protein